MLRSRGQQRGGGVANLRAAINRSLRLLMRANRARRNCLTLPHDPANGSSSAPNTMTQMTYPRPRGPEAMARAARASTITLSISRTKVGAGCSRPSPHQAGAKARLKFHHHHQHDHPIHPSLRPSVVPESHHSYQNGQQIRPNSAISASLFAGAMHVHRRSLAAAQSTIPLRILSQAQNLMIPTSDCRQEMRSNLM